MPLHLDYRPDTLEDFVGSENTIKALKAKIKSSDPPHVFLFTGPSGCGKTTLARIIARHFGAIGKDEEPEDSLDYRELDSSQDRGIKTMREIRQSSNYPPMSKPCKAILLDEVHQVTFDAQEALLKPLEEVPKHVFFFLATTDPQKLKTTLKRRCMHFELDPLTDEEMVDFLKGIVSSEEKRVPAKIIEKVADESLGSPGMALGILDKIIDLPPKEMRKVIERVAAEQNAAIDLCRSIFKKDKWANITSIIRGLKNTKEDPERVRRAVLGYCATILLKKESPSAYLVMDAFRNPFYDSPWEQLVLACYESRYAD